MKFSSAVVNLDDDVVDPPVCVKPMTYAAAVKPMTSAVKPMTSAVKPMTSVAAVKPVNSTVGDALSVESSASAKKSVAKRVSPQHENKEVGDENAPIKLLKRAVKIEKIP
ncbi:hypothetical protein A2U01_0045008 [Trifolium medium]|uniref:Uncharacterized protein n=1 Tax=Trifolium medium TaxID=97028 RepID=A0A392QJT7_9FABA|nr:hypothetical protein [Trifolium medium]